MNLQSAIQSLPVDSEVFCGSIGMLLATPGDHVTDDNVTEVDDAAETFSAYSELQLATVMQWSPKQRMLILLEQFLANSVDG